MAAFNLNNRRDKQRLSTIEKQEIKDKIEAAKIENKIKAEEELLNKAYEDNNAAEIKSIAERIVKLKEELILREKLTQQAIATAIIRGEPIGRITIPGAPTLSSQNILPGLAGPPTTSQGSGDYIPGTTMLSKQGWANQKKDADKYDKDREDAAKRQLELKIQIAYAAADLVYQIGEQIGLDEKSMSLLNAGLNAFTALATGDIAL